MPLLRHPNTGPPGQHVPGMCIGLLVCGLRPSRASRLFESNVPKFTSVTLSPFATVSTMTSSAAVHGGARPSALAWGRTGRVLRNRARCRQARCARALQARWRVRRRRVLCRQAAPALSTSSAVFFETPALSEIASTSWPLETPDLLAPSPSAPSALCMRICAADARSAVDSGCRATGRCMH